MTAFGVFTSRILGTWSKRRMERRLNEEIQCHLELLEQEARERGLSPAEARLAARREFGGRDRTREECRDTTGLPAIETLLQDFRHAVRGMIREPGFALLVMAVLAVGIGACTTVFSILNTLFFRPLPYAHAERLVMMGGAYTRGQQVGPMAPVRYLEYEQWRKQAQSFEQIAAYRPATFVIAAGADPERIRGERIAPGYFEMLGVQPMMGRGFSATEYSGGALRAVVLSEEYWRRTLNGRPDVIGSVLRVDGGFATVVGVMPGQLRATLIEGGPRVWIPLVPSAAELRYENAAFAVLARMKAGVTVAMARAEMAVIAKRLASEHPDPDRDPSIRVDGLQDTLAQAASAPVARVLIMAVSVLLLISCVNVANLLLGRSASRQKEAALRAALGAGRGRLVRQFLVESLAFALTGCIAGVGLAYAATSWCSAKMGPLLANDGIERFTIDARVLGFALLISVATSVVFGILPAFRGSRVNVSDTLKEAGPGFSAGARRQRLNELLVVSEVTLSVVLVASAGLLLHSIAQYWRFDWGVPLDRRLSVEITPVEQTYDTEAKRAVLFGQVLARAQQLPGVESAALVNAMPIHFGAASAKVSIDGAEGVQAGYRVVSAGYHTTAGVALRAGRALSDADGAGRLPVALVSESLARKLWPGKDPIGARIQVDGTWRSIAGVTADLVQDVMRTPKYEVAVPYEQAVPPRMRVLLLVNGDPASAARGLRDAVRALDPDLPFGDVQTLERAKEQLGAPYEFVMGLLSAFAVAAVLLAGAGLYGVASRAVAIRTREIGIRIALGADRRRVFGDVLRSGLRLAITGTAFGSLLAMLMIKALLTKIWWVSPVSAFSWIAPVAAFMAVLAIAASIVPARRATSIAPSLALRAE